MLADFAMTHLYHFYLQQLYIYTYQEMFSIQRSTSRWCVLSSFHSTNEAEIVLDIDRDAGCCRVALDENPSVEPAELKGEDKYE